MEKWVDEGREGGPDSLDGRRGVASLVGLLLLIPIVSSSAHHHGKHVVYFAHSHPPTGVVAFPIAPPPRSTRATGAVGAREEGGREKGRSRGREGQERRARHASHGGW